jgi:pimeloyl-ACP methyl ester carboxylesterase
MPSFTPSSAEIRQPVQLLVGDEDTKFRAIARDLSDRLLHCDLRIIAGAGHNLLLEAPDAVADALLAPVSLEAQGERSAS